jgi:hypothetical protein
MGTLPSDSVDSVTSSISSTSLWTIAALPLGAAATVGDVQNNWIDEALDGLGLGNTDERGWRFAPHGWVVMRASLDAATDGLTERIIGAAMASSDPLRGRFIRAARSAIRVHPC